MKIIIFCGGSGTRMWPMSRKIKPKQFQPLVDDKTIFRQTVERVMKNYSIKDVIISTQKEYLNTVLKEIPEIPKDNIILEPEKRDTLACFGYAVTSLHRKFPDDIFCTMWSDLYVRNEAEFLKAMRAAEKIVMQKNVIVNIDAKPTSPNTSLGYMEIGRFIEEVDGFSVYELVRQIEKPDLEHARQYVRSIKYLWHTGYMVFKASLMLNLYQKYAPLVFASYLRIWERAADWNFVTKEYATIPKTSVDFGIFAKIKDGGILEIPADLGFSDVGLWSILKDELASELKSIVVRGENYDLNSTDSLIYELVKGKIVATIGLENYCIVDTPDALLVCPKYKSQDVKIMVDALKKAGKDKYL